MSSIEKSRHDEKDLRINSAIQYFNQDYSIPKPVDHDLPYYLGLFTKSLPHYPDGSAEEAQVITMISAITNNAQDLNNLKYGGTKKLVDPLCVHSFDFIGKFKSSAQIDPNPSIRSAETAGEMVELFGMSLARDIEFSKWDTDPTILKIIDALNDLSDFKGPKIDGKVTIATLFQAELKDAWVRIAQQNQRSWYLSQFFYRSFKMGLNTVSRRSRFYISKDFCTKWNQIFDIQNGYNPWVKPQKGSKRYMICLRDGITYVHNDDPVLTGTNVAYSLWEFCPLNKGLSSGNQESFVDIALTDIIDVLTRTVRVSLLCAWYNKWNLLRTRPEFCAMELQKIKTGSGQIQLHDDLINSKILDIVFNKQASYLLSQAYPEGSPCHPSYPAGHATFTGAVVTILKFFFDEDHLFDAIKPNTDGSELVELGYQVRVGDELDKLASNIATFRNAAGVHYRSDLNGIYLGENIAIEMLKEHIKRYPKKMKVIIHKRDGSPVIIEN